MTALGPSGKRLRPRPAIWQTSAAADPAWARSRPRGLAQNIRNQYCTAVALPQIHYFQILIPVSYD
jgi:hypothetical protein